MPRHVKTDSVDPRYEYFRARYLAKKKQAEPVDVAAEKRIDLMCALSERLSALDKLRRA